MPLTIQCNAIINAPQHTPISPPPSPFLSLPQHLEQQQGALLQLVKVIKEDLDDLKCIEDGFA